MNQTQYTPVPSFQYAVQRALLPSLLLSPLFFLMNYLYNLSLQHTSLSSSSILSSTSGLWLLLLARVFFRQPISTAGLVGSLCILIGAVAISSRDYAETHQYRPHRGTGTAHHILNHGHANGNNNVDIDFTTPEADGLLGDVCVTLSEICYAGYTLVLHRLIPNELHPSAIDIQVLLGLMGTWTLLLVWPGLFLLHWTGIEPWTSPPSASLMCALVISGVLGAVVPDYLWQRSVVMTSPLVSTLGLTLTIPLSVALDAITQPSPTVPPSPPTLAGRGGEGRWYSVGATLMMVGFLVTNYEHTKTTEQEASASDTPVKDGERFEGRREHNRQLTRVRWSGGSAVATSKRSV